MKILVVGGVAGGASFAARMRRLNEKAEIIMFERGEYISFANCGLPYYIGGEIKDKSLLTLQTPESFKTRFNVDVRVMNEVISIDRLNKEVKARNLRNNEVYTESYDKLILSPGAEALKPDIDLTDHTKVFVLRNIPDTYRIKEFIDNKKPKSAVVIGGGYIGIEMAENLAKAGIKVRIVEFASHVISSLDYDMASDVHNYLRTKGIKLMLNNKVKSLANENDKVKVILDHDDILTDMVIMSVGVKPESKLAKEAGLDVSRQGAIIVNDKMQTSDENIYALGDVIAIKDFVTGIEGYIPLAGPANKQGRIAADNISGYDSSYKGTQGTSVLKVFDMTIATTGINETNASKYGLDYDKSYTFSASHANYYPGSVNMSIKLIFEKNTGKIFGAQIIGYEGVDKRIDVIATAIRAGMSVFDLTELELAYAPPFSSAKDPVNMAGYVAENILTGKVKSFHWDEVSSLPKDGSVTLLDIRTEAEYENGHIDGFINIPLDSLRNKIKTLDKSKPIYVMCQIGLRGYIGSRILSQNGYNSYNLSGGYRLWSSIFRGTAESDIDEKGEPTIEEPAIVSNKITIDACGLQCPGPIMRLSKAVNEAKDGDLIEIKTTDPAFSADSEAWARRTGNRFIKMDSDKGIATVTIAKGSGVKNVNSGDSKNIIVFSGDLDKAIASFVIANAAAAMGRRVTMFFTFWGLNILRKPKKVKVKKDFISRMFGIMMPRGSRKLGLSKMNMGGIGPKMIRSVMKNKNVESLEDLIKASIENGVELVACSMSMDVMGIKEEELIEGVKQGGATAMLANAEESDMSLFI